MIIALSILLVVVSLICIYLKIKLTETEKCLFSLLNDLEKNGKIEVKKIEVKDNEIK